MKVIKSLLIALVLCSLALAAGTPPRPHNSYVYDENRLMSAQQVEYFNRLSEELYRKTGVAIAAALLDNIGHREARSYAFEIAEKWGIGGKSNEGVLIFAALKQRRRSVEVGYGAEGYLPDALVERLQQETLIPAFRKERYGEGVLLLALRIAKVVAHQKNVTLELGDNPVPEEEPMTVRGWIFIIFVFTVLFLMRGNLGRMLFLGMLLNGGRGHGRGFGGGGFGGGFPAN